MIRGHGTTGCLYTTLPPNIWKTAYSYHPTSAFCNGIYSHRLIVSHYHVFSCHIDILCGKVRYFPALWVCGVTAFRSNSYKQDILYQLPRETRGNGATQNSNLLYITLSTKSGTLCTHITPLHSVEIANNGHRFSVHVYSHFSCLMYNPYGNSIQV